MFTTKINETIYYITEDRVKDNKYTKADIVGIIERCKDYYSNEVYYEVRNTDNTYFKRCRTLKEVKEDFFNNYYIKLS